MFTHRIGWVVVALLAAAMAVVTAAKPTDKTGDATNPVDRQIERLIQQLGDHDFFVRERAQAELAKFSFEAFDAISAATKHKDLEIAARARYLLRLMRVEWTGKDDPPEVKKLLENYEIRNHADKLNRMQALAELPGRKGIPALCRLVCYEKSSVLSKRAALLLIGRHAAPRELAELIRKNLGSNRRTAAAWLRTYLRLTDDTQTLMADWSKLVEAEHALLKRSPSQTDAEIVADLVRLQIEWLKQAGLGDQAVVAMQKLIDLETGDPARLLILLDWLIEEEAWPMVDALAVRFRTQFARDALLMYTLADARLAQGKKEQAEETADLALALYPGQNSRDLNIHRKTAGKLHQRRQFRWAEREYGHVLDQTRVDSLIRSALAGRIECLVELKAWKPIDELAGRFDNTFNKNALLLYALARAQQEAGKKQQADETAERALKLNGARESQKLFTHVQIAYRLQRRGWFAWAKREYRHVIETGEPRGEPVLTARSALAEMLHDQGDDLRAAKVLEQLVDAQGADTPNSRQLSNATTQFSRTLGEVRARMHYFFACHFENANDRAKQREHLDKALAADSSEVDVLIACYHFPDKTPEYRKKILALIEHSAARIRQQIVRQPNSPTFYNEFAWLIGNTEGNFDEALRCSRRSLQLRPRSGGYLDTLAHVYFSKGDYENAVKTQTKAVELEPHSGLIRRKLELFKRKLQQQKRRINTDELQQEHGCPEPASSVSIRVHLWFWKPTWKRET